MLVDDVLCERLRLCVKPETYFRAFIVQNRTTGKISCKYRMFRGGERHWYLMEPKDQDDQTQHRLRCILEDVLSKVLGVFGVSDEEIKKSIHCFYPPDDGGDPGKTILWLAEHDLITIKRVE